MTTALIVWDDVIAVAKAAEAELAAIPVPQQNDIMLQAATYTDVEIRAFCAGFKRFIGQPEHDVYVKAMQQYRAAHLGSNINVEIAGEGAFTGISEGGITSNKNQPVNNPQADEGWLETIYGRTFDDYLKSYKRALEEMAKRFVVPIAVYSGGKISGVPVIIPSC